ncbi:MAG: hypothetical protein K0Q50_1272 [Vampirovibrio sp.]|nr:hypothetical protein [Vampirovibrio sp.]
MQNRSVKRLASLSLHHASAKQASVTHLHSEFRRFITEFPLLPSKLIHPHVHPKISRYKNKNKSPVQIALTLLFCINYSWAIGFKSRSPASWDDGKNGLIHFWKSYGQSADHVDTSRAIHTPATVQSPPPSRLLSTDPLPAPRYDRTE